MTPVAPLRAADDTGPIFRLMLLFGLAGALIVGGGLLLFAYFEPASAASGITVSVSGPFRYDPATGTAAGSPTRRFTVREIPAVTVRWKSISARGLEVGAHWYDSNGQQVGGVGPTLLSGLPDDQVVPMSTGSGGRLPPGRYLFAVERYDGGRVVETLARVSILVEPR
jgi:hypothetical protein